MTPISKRDTRDMLEAWGELLRGLHVFTGEDAPEGGEGAELQGTNGVLALVHRLRHLAPAHPLDEAEDDHIALIAR